MSESAVEFVETWVEENIVKMTTAPTDVAAQARMLAAECIKAAQDDGVTQSEINDAFDDLPAFIAGEIGEAFGRKTRPDEGMNLVDDDDTRVINEENDEAAADEKDA
jgi:hypothetical protein